MTVRVSIAIAAYKAADYLEKAVRSALTQTEQDIEVVIVDDCSPDATCAIAHKLAAEDARVHVVALPKNVGGAGALNRAIDAAQGEWVAVLDADDWYEPTRIEKLLTAAEWAGVDMVADNQHFVDARLGRSVRTAFARTYHNRTINVNDFLQHTDPTAAFDYGQLKPMFRKAFLQGHGIRYQEEFRDGFDYFMLFDYFLAGGKALLVDEPLYYYLQPFGSVSKQWAQVERKRYPFEKIKLYNDKVILKRQFDMTPEQIQAMLRRGKGFEVMARLHKVREELAANNVAGAVQHALTAPPAFWLQVVKRGLARLAA
ncbi:MAG TPA: glycosyltransferase family 2 protein [Rickettsiales bacterium]|nr:glycosyltransferase family 2 protein [Rickettsiales bacterium]